MINRAENIIDKIASNGKNIFAITSSVLVAIFTVLPESIFKKIEWVTKQQVQQFDCLVRFDAADINIVLSRCILSIILFVITYAIYLYALKNCKHITIKGNNYSIIVKYGDIFEQSNCKKVISFDECFTTKTGELTAEIKPTSICGQYLNLYPDLNIEQLPDYQNVKPARSKSKYQNKKRYESGTIIQNGDDLLMAFAKLDKKGKGRLSCDEYIKCLDLLWKEIENNYSEKDVCIPVLGAGITAFDGGDGASIPAQDLADMIIWSYKLSSHKIKSPHKLCIVCRKNDGIAITNIAK